MVVLVGVSAFFSSSESAVFSLPADRIAELAGGGGSGATLGRLRDDPHRLLVTILVGNNVVNVAITSITTAILVESLPPGPAVAVATVVASVLVLVAGEIVPKSYGLANAERWALRVAGPLRVVERVTLPVVVVFDFVTRRLSRLVGGTPAIEEERLSD